MTVSLFLSRRIFLVNKKIKNRSLRRLKYVFLRISYQAERKYSFMKITTIYLNYFATRYQFHLTGDIHEQ